MGPRELSLTENDLKKIKKRLMEERMRLEEELMKVREGLAESQAESSGENDFEEDYAESGSSTFEREKELSIQVNVSDLLQKVDRALERMRNGSYGYCLNCGKPIAKERLKALPYAELCITCKRKEERRR
jgi:DnaK suppressor protein